MKARLQPAGMQPLRIPRASAGGVRQFAELSCATTSLLQPGKCDR
jgi:hypothetical protein